MTIRRRPTPDFAGLVTRAATPDQQERARRNTLRHYRDKRLAKKLDDVLGSIDDDLEEARP